MCQTIEKDETEGKVEVTIIRRTNRIAMAITLAFIAISVVVLVLALPLIEQTQIHVRIAQNKINDVWVETPRVSLISTILPPPRKIGINTINVTIPQTTESFQLADIPDDEYIIVWVTNGLPPAGFYTIQVRLIQNNVVVATFNLNITF